MKQLNIGIIGAGYISEYHAKAIKLIGKGSVTAICDVSEARGETFAKQWSVPSVYQSVDDMLEREHLDVVHVLTPPDFHFEVAKKSIQAGIAVLLEKPMCANSDECLRLVAMAEKQGIPLGVGHNFLFSDIYEKLRNDLHSGVLGPLTHLSLTWNRPLGFQDNGPFDIWMLREPGNILLEIGSHLLSEALDLTGGLENLRMEAGCPKELPGGRMFYTHWQGRAEAQGVSVNLNFSFENALSEYYIHCRGLLGSATVDFEKNTYCLDRNTRYGLDFDRFFRTRQTAKDLKRNAGKTLKNYIFSKFIPSLPGNDYLESITRCITAVYDGINSEKPIDSRASGQYGAEVIRICEELGNKADHPQASITERLSKSGLNAEKPTKGSVLVFGGTGFIGRHLAEELLNNGYFVRVYTRQKSGGLLEEHANLEVFAGSLFDEQRMASAFDGIDYVCHLSRTTNAKTWEEYVSQDVRVTESIAELCLRYSVKRLIYTGTIDSFYSGNSRKVITETTPLDRKLRKRNLYARCKAEGESILTKLYKEKGLPVTIVRPGIVIGDENTPAHWGVGMWNGLGVCQVWGRDDGHKLPFVHVKDTARGIVKALEADDAIGKVFHLIDKPKMSASKYLDNADNRFGMQIQRRYTPIISFYTIDLFKWLIKCLVRHPGRKIVPSFRDWKSRTHCSRYDSSWTYSALGWEPEEKFY